MQPITLARSSVVALLFALNAGCAAGAREARMDDLTRLPARVCGEMSGVLVSSSGPSCPSPEDLAAVVESLGARMGAPDGSLDGVRVLLTRDWIFCAGLVAAGCSVGDISAVMIPDRPTGRLLRSDPTDLFDPPEWERVYDWRKSLAHELGHVLRTRAGLEGDGLHRDRTFWIAAEDIRSLRPAFREGDARRQAFAALANSRFATQRKVEARPH